MKRKFLQRVIFGAVALVLVIPGGLVYQQYQQEMTLAYQRIASGGQTIETACGPIQYTEFGEGPPLLMVHGAGGGYDQGAYFAKVIGGDYRWIAPSRFGFLGTPAPADADSVRQAEAHACLLDALGIARVGVVGVSMGGPSALLFAQRYPQRTNSLALISAASHANPPRPAPVAALFKLFLNDFVFWSMVKLSPAGLLVALGVPGEVQQQLSPQEVAELHAFLASIEPMAARREGQLLEQRMSEFDAEQISRIGAPTLILHASDDSLVAFEQGEFAASQIPGAQLIPMAQGGHLALMMAMNEEAKAQLLTFLAQYN